MGMHTAPPGRCTVSNGMSGQRLGAGGDIMPWCRLETCHILQEGGPFAPRRNQVEAVWHADECSLIRPHVCA